MIVVVALVFLMPMGILSAHPSHPTNPPLVWHGPLPDPNLGSCPTEFILVVDAHGNLYQSPCFAAINGVRVVWLVA